MPERGDKYWHIPVRSASLFKDKSFRTIDLGKGIKAVIGKLKSDGKKTVVQKYLLPVSKFKTMKEAKAWVNKHKKEKEKEKKKKKKKKSVTYDTEMDIKSFLGTNVLRYETCIKSFKETEDGERIVRIEISNDKVDSVNERIMDSGLQDIVDTINSGRDIVLYNHDMTKGIGIAKNATLIKEGGISKVTVDAYISKTEDGVWTKIQEGILKGASIGFHPTKVVDEYYVNEGRYVKEIHNLNYFETSFCYMPINQNAGIKYIY